MSGPLSLRGGALVLKSIQLFLAHGRAKNSNPSAANTKKSKSAAAAKSKNKKMQDSKDNKNKITPKLMEYLRRETHFTKSEIESLYKIYRQLISMDRNKPHGDGMLGGGGGGAIRKAHQHEGINRNLFCELLHNTFDVVTEDILADRIFAAWDTDNDGVITVKSWFMGLSVFLRGTLQERIAMCFNIYDINSDGFITKEEMFIFLRNCLISHPQDEDPDEGVKELVEMVLKKMDIDTDGKVSAEDFSDSVLKEPLLLQAFGPCLPSKAAADAFLTTLSLKIT